MLANFWQVLGVKVFERWATVLGTAIIFWTGGIVAWVWHYGGIAKLQTEIQETTLPSALIVLGALFLVLASAILVQHLTFPIVRFLEGYWPVWLQPIQRRLTLLQSKRLERYEQEWQDLASKMYSRTALEESAGLASMGLHDKYTALDQRLRLIPSRPENRMPTRLGNVLRAAESWPRDKYGLDVVVCWPRLWLILPDATKRELAQARASLDAMPLR